MPDFFNVERIPEVLQAQVRGPGEGLENGEANLMQRAMAMRRGQTATPGRGPRGIAPLAKNVLDSKKAVNTALGLGDEDQEALGEAENNPAITPQQYEGLARQRLAAKNKEKPQYQSAQPAAQPKPGEGGGSMTIKKSPEMSAKEWAEGHARLQQAMPGSGNTMQSVVNPGEESENINFGTKGQTPQAQNPASQFIDTYKDKVSPETYQRMQAGLNGGMNLEQLSQMGHQDIQAQEQEKVRDQALKAHTEAMTGKIAQQHLASLQRNLARYEPQIKAATEAVQMGSDDPKEAEAAKAHLDQLLQDQAQDNAEYEELRQAGKPDQGKTAPGMFNGQQYQVNQVVHGPTGAGIVTGFDPKDGHPLVEPVSAASASGQW